MFSNKKVFLKEKLAQMIFAISDETLSETDVLAIVKAIGSKKIVKQEDKRAQQEYNKGLSMPGSSTMGTPLSAAAVRGFQSVVQYLIEELPEAYRFDPNEVTYQNQTALGIAILENHIDLAIYLAGKTTYYPRDHLSEYTALHYAAERGQLTVVEAILEKSPELMDAVSNQGVTAMHRATVEGQVGVVRALLERGASSTINLSRGFTPYGSALLTGQSKVINHFLTYSETCSAINYFYCGINVSPLLIIANQSECFSPKKIEALKILLEAGAGLCVERIPDNVKSLILALNCKLPPFHEWEFLIMGKKEAGEESSVLFLTNFEDLEKALKDLTSIFKWDLIKKMLHDPFVAELAHIKKLNNLILPERIYEFPIEKKKEDPVFPLFPKEKADWLRNLNLHDYEIQHSFQIKSFFTEGEESSFFMTWVLEILKNFSSEEKRNFDWNQTVNNFFYKLNIVVSLALNQHSHQSYANAIEISFYKFIKKLFLFIESAESLNDSRLLLTLIEKLSGSIELFKKIDSKKRSSLYFVLMGTKAYFSVLLSNKYYKTQDLGSAQLLAHRVLYEIDGENQESKKEVMAMLNLTKATCYGILANCCFVDGRVEEGIIHLKEALIQRIEENRILVGKKATSVIIPAVEMVLKNHSESMRPQVIEILKNVIGKIGSLEEKQDEIVEIEETFKARLKEYQEEEKKKEREERQQREQKKLEKQQEHDERPAKLEREVDERIIELESASKQLTHLSLESRKEKVKTRPDRQDQVAENPDIVPAVLPIVHDYGFKNIPEGFMPPIPISGGTLPVNRLFMTMPIQGRDPAFNPFYKLVNRNIIECIRTRGVNEQGFKLGKTIISNDDDQPVQVRTARLKTINAAKTAVRAQGLVEEKIKIADGTLQLFVFRKVLTKKQDERLLKRCKK